MTMWRALLALFASGAGGLGPAEPVDFAAFVAPGSPNSALVAPPGSTLPAGARLAPFDAPADAVWAALLAAAAEQPRTYTLAVWPELRQAQWVARSGLMNYPDIIVAQLQPSAEGVAVVLWSRSLLGYSDFGVNRARLQGWTTALEAKLRPR